MSRSGACKTGRSSSSMPCNMQTSCSDMGHSHLASQLQAIDMEQFQCVRSRPGEGFGTSVGWAVIPVLGPRPRLPVRSGRGRGIGVDNAHAPVHSKLDTEYVRDIHCSAPFTAEEGSDCCVDVDFTALRNSSRTLYSCFVTFQRQQMSLSHRRPACMHLHLG